MFKAKPARKVIKVRPSRPSRTWRSKDPRIGRIPQEDDRNPGSMLFAMRIAGLRLEINSNRMSSKKLIRLDRR